MYTQRLIDNNRRESEFWFKVKTAWLEIMYKEHWGKISKKYFFDHFLELCEQYGIDWDYTDKKGNHKIPTSKDYEYANKNSCFKKYAWDECFAQFEKDQMSDIEVKAQQFYKKSIPQKLIKNEEQYQRIDNNIDNSLSEQEDLGAHNEYRIAKDIESKNQLDDKSRQLAGLDKEEAAAPSTIPVSTNPTHELDEIEEKWDEWMWNQIGEDKPW